MTQKNTKKEKSSKKEKSIDTKTYGLRVESDILENFKALSPGEQRKGRDILKYCLAVFSNGEGICTSTLQLETDIEYLSTKIKQIDNDKNMLTVTYQEQMEILDQQKMEFETKIKVAKNKLLEMKQQENKQKVELEQFSCKVVKSYLQEHNSLLCQEIMENYLEQYTNKECIHALKDYVKYLEGQNVKLENGNIVAIDKDIINEIINLANGMETT